MALGILATCLARRSAGTSQPASRPFAHAPVSAQEVSSPRHLALARPARGLSLASALTAPVVQVAAARHDSAPKSHARTCSQAPCVAHPSAGLSHHCQMLVPTRPAILRPLAAPEAASKTRGRSGAPATERNYLAAERGTLDVFAPSRISRSRSWPSGRPRGQIAGPSGSST